uniref:Amino acid binding protein n=1 Tax=Solanum tuberosum TaxID=4113 RepID=M1DJ24_SOLTU
MGSMKIEHAAGGGLNEKERPNASVLDWSTALDIDGSPIKSDAERKIVIQCLEAVIERRVSEVSSFYYQCLKYLEGGIERKIVADDNPFTEVETHFANAKFNFKGYVVKEAKSNDVKSTKFDRITSKRIDAVVGKAKVDTK